jgi:proteasome activator subunit 4
MHLYNAWLPPPVAAQTAGERDSFARIIAAVNSSFNRDDPESVYSTLKYISVLDMLVPFFNSSFVADFRFLLLYFDFIVFSFQLICFLF